MRGPRAIKSARSAYDLLSLEQLCAERPDLELILRQFLALQKIPTLIDTIHFRELPANPKWIRCIMAISWRWEMESKLVGRCGFLNLE